MMIIAYEGRKRKKKNLFHEKRERYLFANDNNKNEKEMQYSFYMYINKNNKSDKD